MGQGVWRWLGCAMVVLTVLKPWVAEAQGFVWNFRLQDMRDRVVYGPYTVKDGASIVVAGEHYRLRSTDDVSLSFVAPNGTVSGPFPLKDGRIIRIGQRAFSVVSPYRAIAPVLAPPPRRPEERPVVRPPQEPAIPRARSLPKRPALSAYIDILYNTSYDWSVGGFSGNEKLSYQRQGVGVRADYGGWQATLDAFTGGELDGDLLESGLSVSGATLENGSGWRIDGGYQHNVFWEDGWRVALGGRGSYQRDTADLKARVLTSGLPTVGTNGVAEIPQFEFETEVASVEIGEAGLWLDAQLDYVAPNWGVKAAVHWMAISAVDVSGSLATQDGTFELDAERTHPIVVSAGGHVGQDPWRVFTEFALGSDFIWRFGGGYRW